MPLRRLAPSTAPRVNVHPPLRTGNAPGVRLASLHVIMTGAVGAHAIAAGPRGPGRPVMSADPEFQLAEACVAVSATVRGAAAARGAGRRRHQYARVRARGRRSGVCGPFASLGSAFSCARRMRPYPYYLCMHACMYVCTCVCVCISGHIIYVCIHVCMYACLHVLLAMICMYVFVYVCVCLYLYFRANSGHNMHVWILVCMRVCISGHNMHARMHVYVYVCICVSVFPAPSVCARPRSDGLCGGTAPSRRRSEAPWGPREGAFPRRDAGPTARTAPCRPSP